MRYTTQELDEAALNDLRIDAECAERDGKPEYAAKCRAALERYKNGGAHKAVLSGAI